MRAFRLLLPLLVVACDTARAGRAATGFTVSPSPLTLGRVLVGLERQTKVELLSGTRAKQQVTLSTRGPFRAQPELTLEGGGRAELGVTFAPREPGAVTGELLLESSDGVVVRVELSAEGVTAIECPPAAACERFTFDVDSGGCTSAHAPEGTACSSPCVAAGTCSAGVCVGQATACDDHDACTADVCADGSGCIHLDATASCPKGDDPCQVPFCDPRVGCAQQPADDGVSCGASDCATARICLGGQCVTRPTPDGAKCGDPSPCQPAGTCRSGACERQPAQALTPSWSRTSPGLGLDFPGAADARGNLFWLEATALRSELVSVTAQGAQRFRAGTSISAGAGAAPYNDFVIAGARVVLANPGGDGIAAHDGETGALLWERHLLQELSPFYLSASCPARTTAHSWPLLSDGLGHLLVFVNLGGTASCGTPNTKDIWVVSLEASTGATRWKRRYHVIPYHSNDVDAAFDEVGNVYAMFHSPTAAQLRLVSLDSQGVERWSRSLAGSARQLGGLHAGTLVVTGYQEPLLLIDLATGVERFNLQPVFSPVTALVDSTRAVLFGSSGGFSPVTLVGAELGSGALSSAPLRSAAGQPVYRVTTPVLTSRGSVLVAARTQAPDSWTLSELEPGGSVKFECRLPDRDYTNSTLRAGQWTTTFVEHGQQIIASFAVPGLEPAATGWVTSRGKVTKEGRPR